MYISVYPIFPSPIAILFRRHVRLWKSTTIIKLKISLSNYRRNNARQNLEIYVCRHDFLKILLKFNK